MKRIAITCGDPSGLGPELIERCLAEAVYDNVAFRVFGDAAWLDRLQSTGRNALDVEALVEGPFTPGHPEPDGARLAIAAMEAAAAACKDGDCHSVVTGPIAKNRCAAVGYPFPGQTEFFANRWGGEPTMAFVGERLRVCLVTWHIPLSSVPKALTRQAFRKGVESALYLGKLLGHAAPRVLVCGLNPHAGEGGLLGSEERDLLNPWLEELKSEHEGIEGCAPGDTAFGRAMKGEADVVVAMYHDQGLAPFKAVDFDSGVNLTLGLPWLRVSPDHGTGFDIAGRGVSSVGSLRHAIELATWLEL